MSDLQVSAHHQLTEEETPLKTALGLLVGLLLVGAGTLLATHGVMTMPTSNPTVTTIQNLSRR